MTRSPSARPFPVRIALSALAALVIPFAAATGEGGARELAPNLSVREIAKDTFLVTHAFPWASNSLLMKMADGSVLLVDTPYTPEATDALLRWADETLKPTSYAAINTHYHVDRLGGNGALVARHIPVYGSRKTAELVAQKSEWARQVTLSAVSDPAVRAVHEKLVFVAPDHLFDPAQGLRLTFGTEVVDVFYPGPGHTPDNVMVHVPGRRLLFGGCAIVGRERLGNVTEADLGSWITAIRAAKQRDAVLVISGHGGDSYGFSRQLLDHTETLLVEAAKKP